MNIKEEEEEGFDGRLGDKVIGIVTRTLRACRLHLQRCRPADLQTGQKR